MSQRRAKGVKLRGLAAVHKSRRLSPAARDAQGRLHLVLHQDGSGRARVALKAPLFQEAWQNELATSAAGAANDALQRGITLQSVAALAEQAMSATSELADGLLARAANGTVACKQGCAHCCYQSVGVTTPEALAIVSHLERTRAPGALAALKLRVAEARERTRGLSFEQRYRPEYPCVFLEAEQCSIYEVRPLSCRGMNSLDAAECETQLRDPDARAAFLKRGSGGHSFLEPIRAFHAISAGMQLSLSELHHLDMLPLDLIAAVDELLNGAASITEEWLAGRSPLKAARGGDGTGNANAQRVSGALTPPGKR